MFKQGLIPDFGKGGVNPENGMKTCRAERGENFFENLYFQF